MKYLSRIEVTRATFEQLRALCGLDAAFPQSWEAWQRLIEQANEAAAAEGVSFPDLDLDVTRFQSWVRGTEFVPSLDSLRAFVIATRSPGEMGTAHIPLTPR